jgi:cold shock CspA family protein
VRCGPHDVDGVEDDQLESLDNKEASFFRRLNKINGTISPSTCAVGRSSVALRWPDERSRSGVVDPGATCLDRRGELWNAAKGWGAITCADLPPGRDVWVLWSAVLMEGYKTLAPGQRVELNYRAQMY